MATYNITADADKLVAPVAWTNQTKAQGEVDHVTAVLAERQADLDDVKPKVREVLKQIIARAGGTLPDGHQITNVVTNEDGSVTITSA